MYRIHPELKSCISLEAVVYKYLTFKDTWVKFQDNWALLLPRKGIWAEIQSKFKNHLVHNYFHRDATIEQTLFENSFTMHKNVWHFSLLDECANNFFILPIGNWVFSGISRVYFFNF